DKSTNHGETSALGDPLYHRPKIAQSFAVLELLDTLVHRLLGNMHQALCRFVHPAHAHGNGRVAIITFVDDAVVEPYNIAFAQRAFRRNAVNDLIVYRGA